MKLLKTNKVLPVPKGVIVSKRHFLFFLVVAALGLESCANSVRVVSDDTPVPVSTGTVFHGTIFMKVDLTCVQQVEPREASIAADSLGQFIARTIAPSVTEVRTVADLARIEPAPPDVVLYLHGRNAAVPLPRAEISGGWLRVILAAVLGEIYSISSLDLPRYRNTVALPLIGVAFPLFEFLYAHHYTTAQRQSSFEYQLLILRSDGTLMSRRTVVDSARVFFQLDANAKDLRFGNLVQTMSQNVSASVQNSLVKDSLALAHLGDDMIRRYPDDCSRLLAFKRNIYRVLDDTAGNGWSRDSTVPEGRSQ